jgi:hypothetical protein
LAIDAPIDVELLKSEIKRTYSSVSEEPERDFIFPTGRAWAPTYARSKFEDTRRKAQKFGARGTTVRAYKGRTA